VLAGMIWYKPFFGDSARVAQFFAIPESVSAEMAGEDEAHSESATAEAAEGEAHGDAAAEGAAATAEGYGAVHHFAFGGNPGDGAIFIGPANHVLDEAHASPTWVKVSPFVAMLIGFVMSLWFYIANPALPGQLAANQRPLYLFLLNKWYFDEIYEWAFVRPTKALGRILWKQGDGTVIDGSLNGIAMGIVPFFTRLAGRAQSGYVFTYAFAMVIGVAVLLTWVSLTGGAE
jgi:NADH-quinone oxidoreductase subunit L